MRLLVGYIVHEVTSDLEECMCLSLTSLNASTDADVIVFCRAEVACSLPQLGVNVCVVEKKQEGTLEHGAALHQIVSDHGGGALLLLEPTTLVLKDMTRDATEMKSLIVTGSPDSPDSPDSQDSPVLNCLSPDTPQTTSTMIDRGTLPLVVTDSLSFGKKHSVKRWICGYSYSFGGAGNAVNAGLCTTRGASEMVRAMRGFQCGEFQHKSIRVKSSSSSSSSSSRRKTNNVKYYAVLLRSRAERVAIVDDMRKSLPDGSLTVVPAVEGSAELDAARLSKLTLSGFLSPPYFDAYVPYRPILVNSVASFLSHVRAIEKLVEDLCDDSVGVILEDDIRLLGPEGAFHAKVMDTCRSVWWENPSAHKPDVVQMYVMPTQRVFVNPIVLYGQGRMKHDEHVVQPSPESNWGMQCYMMRLEGAKKLLEGFKTMKGAVDEQISRIPGLDLRCLVGRSIIEEDTKSAPSVTQSTQSGVPRYVKDVMASN